MLTKHYKNLKVIEIACGAAIDMKIYTNEAQHNLSNLFLLETMHQVNEEFLGFIRNRFYSNSLSSYFSFVFNKELKNYIIELKELEVDTMAFQEDILLDYDLISSTLPGIVYSDFHDELIKKRVDEIVNDTLGSHNIDVVIAEYNDCHFEAEDLLESLQDVDCFENLNNYIELMADFIFHTKMLRAPSLLSFEVRNALEQKMHKRRNKAARLTLNRMFTNPEDLSKIESMLKSRFYVSNDNGSMEWTPPSSGHFTAGKYLTGLYLSLTEKGYLRKDYKDVQIAYALSEHFNFDLTNKNVGDNKRAGDMKKLLENYDFIPRKVK